VKITYKNKKIVNAYAGASHCQFMLKKDCLNKIFPKPRNWALSYTERDIDNEFYANGFFKLTTEQSYVYHLGNTLNDEWRKVLSKFDDVDISVSRVGDKELAKTYKLILSIPFVRRAVIFFYNYFFKLMYRIK
jgi:hypothetical protein